MAQMPTTRDRHRAATKQEILRTARRLLVRDGPEAVSLRAIAREMGMTAPALYRYFGSHEDLLRHLTGSIFTEIADHVRAAITAAAPAGDDLANAGVTGLGLIAGCREFRAWSLTHLPEFCMLFRLPAAEHETRTDDPIVACGRQFGIVLLDSFASLFRQQPFGIPADDDIQPSLRWQLARYRASNGSDLPLGALQTFLRCWMMLYGTVSVEAFGQLRFALDDPAPMFELMLENLAPMLGLAYPPPAHGSVV